MHQWETNYRNIDKLLNQSKRSIVDEAGIEVVTDLGFQHRVDVLLHDMEDPVHTIKGTLEKMPIVDELTFGALDDPGGTVIFFFKNREDAVHFRLALSA